MFPNSYFSTSYFPESYFPPVEALKIAQLRGYLFWDEPSKKKKKKKREFREPFRREIERVINEALTVNPLPFNAPKEIREAAQAVKQPYVADVQQQVTLARYLQASGSYEHAERLENALLRWAFATNQAKLEREQAKDFQARQAAYDELIAQELVSMWYERQNKLRIEQEEMDFLLLALLTEEL